MRHDIYWHVHVHTGSKLWHKNIKKHQKASKAKRALQNRNTFCRLRCTCQSCITMLVLVEQSIRVWANQRIKDWLECCGKASDDLRRKQGQKHSMIPNHGHWFPSENALGLGQQTPTSVTSPTCNKAFKNMSYHEMPGSQLTFPVYGPWPSILGLFGHNRNPKLRCSRNWAVKSEQIFKSYPNDK